ncbi:hypothetical protein D3C78_1755480 [compost metagenome]
MTLVRIEPHRRKSGAGGGDVEHLAVRVDLGEVRVEKPVQLLDRHDGLDFHKQVFLCAGFGALSEAGRRFYARRKKVLGVVAATDLKARKGRRTTGVHRTG